MPVDHSSPVIQEVFAKSLERHNAGVRHLQSRYFPERLKALRKSAKMSTQQALADRSGLPVDIIRDMEQGKLEPTLAAVLRLAAGLGVGLSAFEPPAETVPAE
jgi:DNA-binding transcriptional regulator YiaG